MYKAIYRDSNDAENKINLTAKTVRGAKSQATHHAPAMNHITIVKNDKPIATRSAWQNPSGHFGLDRWIDND